mmetsp:Transcript_31109/g.35906  ORF Transcript_31109/g.35906 Transcript_31109/m.35906 type:complete len:88 (-) Transcript_31109:77-340(-)
MNILCNANLQRRKKLPVPLKARDFSSELHEAVRATNDSIRSVELGMKQVTNKLRHNHALIISFVRQKDEASQKNKSPYAKQGCGSQF